MIPEHVIQEEKKDILIKEIVDLYRNIFGSITAEIYQESYRTKDVETILLSFNELILEYAGEKKSEEIVKDIYRKCGIA